MNKLNQIFALSSLSVLLVTVERFSFTTKILLQPYNFLRLHELFQMLFLILFTVIIPTLLLKEVTHNFELSKIKNGFILIMMFIIGIYFYATGNGLHEVTSFYLNNYCNTSHPIGIFCQSLFFNDYYTGNILYFIGALFMTLPLLLFESTQPNRNFVKKDFPALIINAVIYALALFAYAAFDKVLVGLIYVVILTGIALVFFIPKRKNYLQFPITTYTALTYLLGLIAAIIVKII